MTHHHHHDNPEQQQHQSENNNSVPSPTESERQRQRQQRDLLDSSLLLPSPSSSSLLVNDPLAALSFDHPAAHLASRTSFEHHHLRQPPLVPLPSFNNDNNPPHSLLPTDIDDDNQDDFEDEEDDGSSSIAPSSVPPTSLAVDDPDDRFGFGSSAESDRSCPGMIDQLQQSERNRVQKKRRKPTSQSSSNHHHHHHYHRPQLRPSYSDHYSSSSRPPSPHSNPSAASYWTTPSHTLSSSSSLSTTAFLAPSLDEHQRGTGRSSFSTSPPDPVPTACSSRSSASANDYASIPIDLDKPEYFNSHHLRTAAQSSQPSESLLEPVLPYRPPKRGWFSSRRQKRKNSIHALSATSNSSTTSLLRSSYHSKHEDRNQKPSLGSSSSTGVKYSNSSTARHHHRSSATSTSSSGSTTKQTGLPSSGSNPSSGRFRRLLRLTGLFIPKHFSLRYLRKSLALNQPLGILLALLTFISFAVSLTTFLIHFLDTDKEPLPWRTYCQEQADFPHQLADSIEPINVFVGVFSTDSSYERREMIRSTYARHSKPIDPRTGMVMHNVQVKFVLGKPRIQHVRRIALEMETYNDLVILDIHENMNRGKTFAYFSWANENATVPVYYRSKREDENDHGPMKVSVGFKKADFVVKADDDAFIVLSELERHLRIAPRTKTYWGYLIRNLFMGGECYALSSDLVNYVATSERVLDHLTGAEDKKVAKWMRIHPNATQINWVTERCWIYDHPKAGTTYAHGFLFPDEVERVRAEGRRGLTEAEIETRGGLVAAQAYSTVTKWKQRYVPPKNMMTMEEEVEALIEGGGRYANTNWRAPPKPESELVPMDRVKFEHDDERLRRKKKTDSVGHSIPPARLDAGELSTPPVRDHYEEMSLKFGRPPSELMAKLGEIEDLPESKLKETLMKHEEERRDKAASAEERLESRNKAGVVMLATPIELNPTNASKPRAMVERPTLRYDPEDMKIRDQRFLGRAHGGTVVVHFLKRSEWFLETSLVLLGRSKTWDDGLIPGAYGNSLRESLRPGMLSVEEDGNEKKKPKQEVEVVPKIEQEQGELEEVEEIGEMLGGARLYGSAIVSGEGKIIQGRRQDEPNKKQGEKVEVVEPIRQSQFGGAGWIRGKPRLRVTDMEDIPEESKHKTPEDGVLDHTRVVEEFKGQTEPEESNDQEQDQQQVLLNPIERVESAGLAIEPLNNS